MEETWRDSIIDIRRRLALVGQALRNDAEQLPEDAQWGAALAVDQCLEEIARLEKLIDKKEGKS